MSSAASDPSGYYRVLNLSPGATDAEVRLAYTFLKNEWQMNRKIPRARIKEAYDFLCDPNQKEAYDAGRAEDGGGVMLRVTGAALLTGLVLFWAFVFPGVLQPGRATFHAGDRLHQARVGAFLGEVVRKEEGHRFPNGAAGDAYLVRLEDGSERWFPTTDLEAHYRAR